MCKDEAAKEKGSLKGPLHTIESIGRAGLERHREGEEEKGEETLKLKKDRDGAERAR